VILPEKVDVDVASDEEILAAYADDGVPPGAARAYLDAIRGRTPAEFIVD
jgi:hypothetical protein